MKVLVVVDMQRDFVDGALGTKEAVEILPAVTARVKKAAEEGETILFTRDTHQENYLETKEGQNLPIKHCIQGTEGWELVPELREYTKGREVINKPTFGSEKLGRLLAQANVGIEIEEITLIGLCTDICVISNALLLKTFLPETKIAVEARCCAGVTPESHENALRAMSMCQIEIR